MWSALARFFCSAHVGTGSETTVEQESQQVRASGIDPSKCCVEYAEPYIDTFYEVESEASKKSLDFLGLTDIIISEKLYAQLQRNASMHWLVPRLIRTTNPNPNELATEDACFVTSAEWS